MLQILARIAGRAKWEYGERPTFLTSFGLASERSRSATELTTSELGADTLIRCPHRFDRIAVLGLGLIGGSVLQALARGGYRVIGYDPDPNEAGAARGAGYELADSAAAAVTGADLVVLAMPLPDMPGALDDIRSALSLDAVVTDVGTLKTPVLPLVAERLPGVRFIGGHPLAGTEESGFLASDPMLFRDAPWSLVLEPDTDLAAWLGLTVLLCDLGARPVPDHRGRTGHRHRPGHRAAAHPGRGAGPDRAARRRTGTVPGGRLLHLGQPGRPNPTGTGRNLVRRQRRAGQRLGRHPVLAERAPGTRWPEASRCCRWPRPGHHARMNWETREFGPVDLPADPTALRQHGRDGGWITAVIEKDGPAIGELRLLGMRPL